VAAVSLAALFIRLSTAPSLVIALYRMSLAFLLQAPFLWRGAVTEIRRGGVKPALLAVLAGLALAGHFAAWIGSLKLTTVASSTVLVATQPLWVVAGSYLLFRERLPWRQALALLCSLAGALLIGWGDIGFAWQVPGRLALPSGALAGDLLAVLGAMLMAVYLMAGRRAQVTYSVGTYTFVAYGVSSAALLTAALIQAYPLTGYAATDWLAFLGLAVVCTLGGHSLLNWSLRYLPASTVSTAVLGEPVGATLWALLFLGEAPRIVAVAGGLLVLIGLVAFTRGLPTRSAPSP
jgi:drug/metabolite transporter (DMT)-like permease